MSITVSYDIRATFGAVTISGTERLTAETTQSTIAPVPAGKSGTLSTRTNNTEGTLSLSTGHGITTGQVIDLYWANGSRYGVVVGTVSGNTVPISGGAGDNLPSANTAIVASPRVQINVVFDGDDIVIIGAQLSGDGRVTFIDASSNVIASVRLLADVPWIWTRTSGAANPLTGNPVVYVMASTSGTNSAVIRIGTLLDTVA